MTTEITSFAAMAELRSRLSSLPEVCAKIATRGAAKFSELGQQAFDARQSPYGDAWGVGEDGQPIDLKQSGALREKAIRYTSVGTTIRSSVASVKHARYQLKRGLLPKAGRLPAAWEGALKTIAQDELAKAMAL